jgi:hypothetical protein
MFDQDVPERQVEKWKTGKNWECKNCRDDNYSDETQCDDCKMDRRYSTKELGMPCFAWKELREMYKENIMKDVPEEIPESAAKHLRSDMERYMYKRARMLVNICIDRRVWDQKYNNPTDLQIRLQNLDMGDVPESMRKARIMDYLEEIYWQASMNLCEVLVGEAELFGYMGLLLRSRHRAGSEQIIKERFEKLKDHPTTTTVKGSKDMKYFMNVDLQMCSCPSYKYHGGPCKHLVAQKK